MKLGMAKKFFFSLVTLQCAPLSCINPNFDLSNLTEGKVYTGLATNFKYTANVSRDLQGLCGEIRVRGFQIYGDCMYTGGPRLVRILGF